MDKQKYNVLVWAKDAGKFAKEFKTKFPKDCPEEIEKVTVLGSELKIDDLKALQSLPVSIAIDKEYASEKKNTELVFVGRCFENGLLGVMPYIPLEKEVSEVLKNIGVPVTVFSTIKAETVVKRSRKQATLVEEKTLVVSEKENELAPKKTRRTVNKEKTDSIEKVVGKNTGVSSDIKKLIDESNLPQEEKKFFTYPENLAKIAYAIRNASDVKIGFPFQLQVNFGAKGALLLPVLEKSFYKIRKEPV